MKKASLQYACNQLFDIKGDNKGSCVVEVSSTEHFLLKYFPLNGIETPFTQWLGGSMILSRLSVIPNNLKCNTLDYWIKLLQENISTSSEKVYIWHTEVTNLNEIVTDIHRL